MGLCYSKTEKGFGKSHYPYKDVTPLALLLWRYYLPWVRTLVRIVYEKEKIDPMMKEYAAMLERSGAVVDWVPAGQMDCVRASQLVRMFAIEVEQVPSRHQHDHHQDCTRVSAFIYCLMKWGTIMAQYTLKICHYAFVSAELVH